MKLFFSASTIDFHPRKGSRRCCQVSHAQTANRNRFVEFNYTKSRDGRFDRRFDFLGNLSEVRRHGNDNKLEVKKAFLAFRAVLEYQTPPRAGSSCNIQTKKNAKRKFTIKIIILINDFAFSCLHDFPARRAKNNFFSFRYWRRHKTCFDVPIDCRFSWGIKSHEMPIYTCAVSRMDQIAFSRSYNDGEVKDLFISFLLALAGYAKRALKSDSAFLIIFIIAIRV